jgi:hypothetical protein
MSAVRGIRLEFHPFWTRYRAKKWIFGHFYRDLTAYTSPITRSRIICVFKNTQYTRSPTRINILFKTKEKEEDYSFVNFIQVMMHQYSISDHNSAPQETTA